MAKLSPGIKAFRANIRAMKKLGKDVEKQRAREARANQKSHLAAMNARAQEAEALKAQIAADGVARRNEHNARLAAEKAARLERIEQLKVRAA